MWKDVQGNKHRYVNIEQIGEGRFSMVYKAQDSENNNKEIVIKVQKAGKSNNEVFVDELEILNKLSKNNEKYTENVVQILDNFRVKVSMDKKKKIVGDRICLVFDKMKCNLLELKDDIYKSALPISIVKHIARQIIEGINFLHQNKVIHTDIKPENILIDEQSNVKVADLGNGCFFDNHVADKTGTSEYRSLESIICAKYDEKVDMWATACLIFELLTDDYLFDSWAYVEEIESSDDDELEDKKYFKISESNSSLSSSSSSEDGSSKNRLNDIQHLHLMEMTLGKIPKYLSRNGEYFDDLFHRKGNLREPVERVEKMTIAEYLNYDYNFSKDEAKEIEEFLLPMLEYDPKKRATAAEMLNHKWLK